MKRNYQKNRFPNNNGIPFYRLNEKEFKFTSMNDEIIPGHKWGSDIET